ncbi:uncharacterized protein M6B38_164825 [Iris pallida]|uniref:Uncharacterized protein n=1 Tax=Iris pallida TaxID=29817 RepID=A0AAX6EXS3_IRIPA|nr:uncharacterized protein M6B38_164825 [Iris pallida]
MPRTMVVLLQTLTLVLLLLVVVVAATSSASGVGDVRNIHELLRSHGLPAGLLPTTVSSFSFDPSSGLLEAELERPCYARYDGMAYFERAVRGNLTYGELRGWWGSSRRSSSSGSRSKGSPSASPPRESSCSTSASPGSTSPLPFSRSPRTALPSKRMKRR